MRRFGMAKKQQKCLPERVGMCSVVNSSMKFVNKSIWNNPKISVPKICKIGVSWSLKNFNLWVPILIITKLANHVTHGPRDYLDTQAFDIFGKSVPMRNFKKWY